MSIYRNKFKPDYIKAEVNKNEGEKFKLTLGEDTLYISVDKDKKRIVVSGKEITIKENVKETRGGIFGALDDPDRADLYGRGRVTII